MKILIGFVYLIIAYGSLFPFNFSIDAIASSGELFLNTQVPSLGDFIGNIILFFPLGLLYALKWRKLKISSKQTIINCAAVLAFALLLQILQVLLPSRDQNLVDVILNMLGFYFGYAILLYTGRTNIDFPLTLSHLPIAIGVLFVVSQLSPFIPSIDFQSFKDSVKPLLALPTMSSFNDTIVNIVWWLMALRLIHFGRDKIALKYLIGGWLLFLLAKIFIYYNALAISDIVAPLCALILFAKFKCVSSRQLLGLIGIVLLTYLYVSIDSLASFNLSLASLKPFHSYLTGEIYINIQSLLFRLFIFSGLIWLAIEAELGGKKMAVLLGCWVLFVEFLQLFMPSKSFDLGDILLVFCAYYGVRHTGDYLATIEHRAEKISGSATSQSAITSPKECYFKDSIRAGGYFLIGFVILVSLTHLALSSPSVPYNIRELFAHDGSIMDLFSFYLFLLVVGGSAAYVVQQAKPNSNEHFSLRTLLYRLSLVTILCFGLIALAVTDESLQDILGSSLYAQSLVVYQRGTNISSLLINVFSFQLASQLVTYLEYFIRLTALLFLYQLPLMLLLVLKDRPVGRTLPVVSALFALFISSYFCTFYAPATDNLTELIARPWLVALIFIGFVISVYYQLALRLYKGNFRVLASYMLALFFSVLSWFIAGFAFEDVITKYGISFSALEFMLGPDRETNLSYTELMLRWTLITFVIQRLFLFSLSMFTNLSPLLDFAMQKLFAGRFSSWTLSRVSAVVICSYILFRLFGPSNHWQTIAYYMSDASPVETSVEVAKPMLPINPQPGIVKVNGTVKKSLSAAFNSANDADEIHIGKGHYNVAVQLTASFVRVIAEKGAVIYGKAMKGKGAILVTGDGNYIEGLECHSISVPDNNGTCIRLEGKGITLNNVYFHHAQGGLLGSPKGGDIIISHSKFEHMGLGSFFHGIYTLAPTRLFIDNSEFLSNNSHGHEIKSRSRHTQITNTVVANGKSRDSRLIDVPNGGVLILRNNILVEGASSVNHDLLSWGVEGITHKDEQIIIEKNLIISDKFNANLISVKGRPTTQIIQNNIVVGNITGILEKDNMVVAKREDLSIPDAPFVPKKENLAN